MDISELNISVYARNALYRGGIHTIEQLSELTLDELLKIRQIGGKSADEIVTALQIFYNEQEENKR